MRALKVAGLAGLLALTVGASAQAGWKGIIFPQGQTIPQQTEAGAFLNAFTEKMGSDNIRFRSVLSLSVGMPEQFIAEVGRFVSLSSFDLDGVTVHQYINYGNPGATDIEAIALKDRSADWFLAVLKAWAGCSDCGTGGALMVRAFAGKVAAEESASTAKKAVAKFKEGLRSAGLLGVGYEGDAQAKVDAFRGAVSNLDTDTLMDWTEDSEATELAKRGLKLVQEKGITSALGQ